MHLNFSRSRASPDAMTDDNPSLSTASVTPPKKQPPSPPRSPAKKISPLQVQIPDADDHLIPAPSPFSEMPPPSPAITVRPAELTLEFVPPSPISRPSSAASSPQARGSTVNKQSQMRGLSIMSYRIKQLVSKEKRRFDEDGFNLDLTYVTNRLIAFGYPAENLEGFYRNHYKDVYNFFERRHPGRYKIYNLCAEKSYDKEKFHGRVGEFPFYDHCPPPLALFAPFCEDVNAWLSEHPDNVAAIHCKAGKGRTGVMICAYLLYTRAWTTAYAAMEFFGAARSLKREGVTIPSQRRFIRYFAEMCREAACEGDHEDKAVKELAMKPEEFHQLWEETIDGRGLPVHCLMAPSKLTLPISTRLVLTGIKINGVYTHKRIDPRVRIDCGVGKTIAVYEPIAVFTPSAASSDESQVPPSPRPISSSSLPSTPGSKPSSVSSTPSSFLRNSTFWSTSQLELRCDRLLVWDEVKVSLRHRSGAKIGHFWFHTAFVPSATYELVIPKEDIDKANKDTKKGHKQFAPDFSVTLVFEKATPEDMAVLREKRRTNSAPEAAAAVSPMLRPFASLNDKLSIGGLRFLDSPARARATSDQSSAPFSSAVVSGDADAEPTRSPSASIISAGKVSPLGSRSAPSSPKAFPRRLFG